MSYTFTALDASLDYIQAQINAEPIANDGISTVDDQMTVLGTFTAPQEATILGFVPGGKLAFAKEAKLDAVFAHTKALVLDGFTYSAKLFPLILDHRSNYVGIQVLGGFPYKIQTRDHKDILDVADQTAYNPFLSSGLSRFRYIKDGESGLIEEVRYATTIVAVNAIVDSRS